MRIAFIGVSHWHAPVYYRSAARLAGVEIVAVSDPNPAVAQIAAKELGAKSFTDYRNLTADARPDFIFAFARHCDMAATAMTLIDEGIPFLMEKPVGLSFQQVSDVRDRARAKGLYVGTGFNFRVSDLFKTVQSLIGDNQVTHCSFRWIGGGPYRYRESGCHWMLDPQLSGGGSTINLSVHFMDMFRQFTRSKPSEVAAMMGHFTWNLPIEDYSSVIMRSPQSICTIETGYTYPAPSGVFDLRYSIRTTRHYLIARSDDVLEIHRTSDGHMDQIPSQNTNSPWYPLFVSESIDRFAKGLPPVASLDDLADVMEMVDAAYASDRAGGMAMRLNDQR